MCFLVDVFNFDPKYLENEEKYKSIKAEILGEDSADELGSGLDDDDDDDSEEEEGKSLFFICLGSYSHV